MRLNKYLPRIMPQAKVNNSKNKSSRFHFKWIGSEYEDLLKKYDGDVLKLNQALKTKIKEFISKNKKKDFSKTRKGIYMCGNEMNDVMSFCYSTKISQPELADNVKRAVMNA